MTRSYGRQYPDGPLEPPPGWPEGAGEFMRNMLGGQQEPGPPWTHTLVPPEPTGQDEDGNPLYPEPGPAMTLTERQ